ncbi:MAG TPA: spermidine/putrescine ABC transporter substrate-binding protein [Porticoccus sp.]|nr:spermidine/putrescine ABC transporter substrate-binding protein [Porticoccus sp.]
MLIRAILLLVLLIPYMPLKADTVTLYTWAQYIAPTIGDKFYKDTGHVLNVVTYPNVTVRNGKLLQGRADVDLILMSSLHIHFMQKMGKLNDISSIPFDNKKHIDSRWLSYCGSYGIAYSWGTTGIAYRSSIATRKITSWKQFFEPESALSGRIVFSMDESTPVSMALLALGEPINSTSEHYLEKAVKLLNAQSTHVLAYEHGSIYAELNGTESKMAMTLTYSSDIFEIKRLTGNDDWVYVIPEEGGTLWVDCFGNPATRPLSAAALAFLNYINRPDIAALNAEYIKFSTTNTSALKLTSESYRNDPLLFPNPELIGKKLKVADYDRKTFTRRRNIARKIKESKKFD